MIEREGRLRGEILSRQQRLIEKIDEGARPPIEIIAEPSSLLEPPAIAEPQPTVVPVQAGGKPDSIDRWGTAALVFSGMTLLGVVLILLVSLSDQKRITAEIQSLSTLLQARPVPRPKRRARKRPAKPIEDRAATRPQLKVRNLMES